jgi:hypothetical protein
VYDLPFLMAGTSCTDVENPVHHNDKSCVGHYYGITHTARHIGET